MRRAVRRDAGGSGEGWPLGGGCVPESGDFFSHGNVPETVLRQPRLTFNHRWDDWVPQERIRKLTEENKELASNLKKDMDAQRRAATSKPASTSTKKRAYGSDLAGSSARGSEDRSSAAPQAPRGTKRGKEIEGIDKVGLFLLTAGFGVAC